MYRYTLRKLRLRRIYKKNICFVLKKNMQNFPPVVFPQFGEHYESEESGTNTTILREDIDYDFNGSLATFFGGSVPLASTNGWNLSNLNIPSSPKIFKGSVDSPPLFLRSPSGNWFAACPLEESQTLSGKLYGLLDVEEDILTSTKAYFLLGKNQKVYCEGTEKFTMNLTPKENALLWFQLKHLQNHAIDKLKSVKMIPFYGFFGEFAVPSTSQQDSLLKSSFDQKETMVFEAKDNKEKCLSGFCVRQMVFSVNKKNWFWSWEKSLVLFFHDTL
eukprot:GHVP01002679.1.p1 GENE.GHVP01002679.1~~GHVP01002679.1.p1  ORF type:complete len:274 (+),score=43.34 GHVP01002679.1:63-884(+)